MDSPLEPTPPKSAQRIRETLESVRRPERERPRIGPREHGMADDEPLLVATFRNRDCCRAYQEALLREGVMSQAEVHRVGSQVLVDYSDRDLAADVLQRHLVDFPDLPPETWRRDYDFTLFGTFLGGTLGAVFTLAEFRDLRAWGFFLTFSLFGALIGLLLDRPRNRYRQQGEIQFGVGDLLVLVALVALAIAIGKWLNAG